MGLNQIINMIMRIIMRKTINSGINAGMRKMSRGGKQTQMRQQDQYDPMLDDGADFDDGSGPSQAEIRRQRQAKRAARQARQAAKATGKVGRM